MAAAGKWSAQEKARPQVKIPCAGRWVRILPRRAITQATAISPTGVCCRRRLRRNSATRSSPRRRGRGGKMGQPIDRIASPAARLAHLSGAARRGTPQRALSRRWSPGQASPRTRAGSCRRRCRTADSTGDRSSKHRLRHRLPPPISAHVGRVRGELTPTVRGLAGSACRWSASPSGAT
jgi:hypothetical protein